jgi:hypothetical protein
MVSYPDFKTGFKSGLANNFDPDFRLTFGFWFKHDLKYF